MFNTNQQQFIKWPLFCFKVSIAPNCVCLCSIFVFSLSNMKTWVKIIPLKLFFSFSNKKWRGRLRSYSKLSVKVIYIHPFPPTFGSYNTQGVTKVRSNINTQHHLKSSFQIRSPEKFCNIILLFYVSRVVFPSQKTFWWDFVFVLFFYS